MAARGERYKAIQEGRKTYFTGLPCPRGHVSQRHVYLGCLECRPGFDKKSRLRTRTENPEKLMFWEASRRARKSGLPFDIQVSDIVIPDVCPLLGIKIEIGAVGNPVDGSPSLDRIECSKGYVVGNVWVISHRANTLKSNATLEELQMLTANLAAKVAQTN